MSVLIKGMEMPKDCENCPMLDDNGDYPTCILTWTSQGYNWSPIGHRMRNCPIVEVPAPHGRLIDAKALTKDLGNRWNVNDDQDFCNKEVWHGIEEAPTVIEAEEGE